MRFILSLALISFYGFAQQTCHKANTTTASKTEAVKTNANSAAKTDEHPADDAPRITLADAKKDFDAGNAIFIDTRGADSYKLEHVKGAINISLNEVGARYKEIPAGKKIIAYCS